MARPVTRNNVIAGVFVIVSMVLAVVISIAVSGAQQRLRPTSPYIVRFSVTEGTAGLKPGSPVTLGGQEVGRVARVEFGYENGIPTSVDVHVQVDAGITLYQDAWAFLERPLLGSMSSVNIARVGGEPNPETGASASAVPPGGMIQGQIAPPSFLAQAGFGPEQVRQFRVMMAQAASAVERIERITAKVEAELEPDLKGIRAAIDDVSSMTADVRQKLPAWTERTDRFLASLDEAGAQLRPLLDQVSDTVANADRTVTDLREAIEANRPALDRFMANIDAAAREVREVSVPAFNEAMQTGREGVQAFSEANQRFNALIQEQTPNLRNILGNLRLAADQAKLTMVEVRRNPWRLLYTPKTKELEAELFYDAARTYAEAVSDLRAASEALEITARDNEAGPAVHRETLDHILQRLEDAFQRYRQAEMDLLEMMAERRP